MSIEYTEDMIDALYQIYDHNLRRNVGYHRDAFMNNPDGGLFRHRAKILSGLISHYTETVLIVGMGLGCLNEALMEVRPELRIYGIDPAPYVVARQDEMQLDVRSLWLPLDVTFRYAKKRMRDAWGLDHFDVVITEDVLTGYTLDEAPPVLLAVERFSPNPPIHYVSVRDRVMLEKVSNIRPLQHWVDLKPSHVWVGSSGVVVTPDGVG